jgi:predicted dehydrogenase
MVRPRHDLIVLQGDRGRLQFDRFVSPQHGGSLLLQAGGERRHIAPEGPGSYDAQLAHVVEVMSGRASPLTGGADSIANMRVLDRMRQLAGMPIA